MGFLIGFMTFILVVNCIVLMLLILIQLPKKEAGVGTAFGGGATDALFGAGTGNALTKMTKYAATIFFLLSICLSILSVRAARQSESSFHEAVQKQSTKSTPAAPAAPTTPPITLPATPSNSFSGLVSKSNAIPSSPAPPPQKPAK